MKTFLVSSCSADVWVSVMAWVLIMAWGTSMYAIPGIKNEAECLKLKDQLVQIRSAQVGWCRSYEMRSLGSGIQ